MFPGCLGGGVAKLSHKPGGCYWCGRSRAAHSQADRVRHGTTRGVGGGKDAEGWWLPSIGRTDLSDNDIGDGGLRELTRALEEGAPCWETLTLLDVRVCDITSLEVGALSVLLD